MGRIWLGLVTAFGLTACSSGSEPVTFFSILPQSKRDLAAPANLPPPGWDSEFWIDKRGCTYVRTETGQWVPQLNLDRTRKCDRALAWEPVDFSQEPTSLPTPMESVDPVTGVVTRVLPPKIIPDSYVQVGFFADRAAGLAARQRFLDLGFPVVGSDTPAPEGKGITLVLGPFTEEGLLKDGLTTAVAFGHTDAYTFRN